MQRDSQKVVLLGEGCVGKTSIVVRYTYGTFNEQHKSTLQAAYFDKKVSVDGKRLTLAIWDTAGQERFHALGPIYYRDSRGAILVYDITDQDSFSRVKNWVRELRRVLGNDVILFIVGNKIDLEKDRKVSLEEAENYVQSVGARHMQTSARVNRGIDQLFLEMSKALLERIDREASTQGTFGGRNVVIVDDTAPQGSQRGCCG